MINDLQQVSVSGICFLHYLMGIFLFTPCLLWRNGLKIINSLQHLRVSSIYSLSMRVVYCHCRIQRDGIPKCISPTGPGETHQMPRIKLLSESWSTFSLLFSPRMRSKRESSPFWVSYFRSQSGNVGKLSIKSAEIEAECISLKWA